VNVGIEFTKSELQRYRVVVHGKVEQGVTLNKWISGLMTIFPYADKSRMSLGKYWKRENLTIFNRENKNTCVGLD
jgi:hypothetical protein